MRKVLIISPHFPPINAPDHQRIRMSLPFFREFGWEPYVLTVRPEYVEGIRDDCLAQTIPKGIPVIHTAALPFRQTRKIGLGSLGLRCLPHMRAAGSRIIAQEKIDLVYFSTTMFAVMGLASGWRKRFGVPYVLDFQDPWLSDYYHRPDAPPPPGNRFKYGFAQTVAHVLEPRAMRHVSHTISVSPAYPQTLMQRYPWLHEDQFTVLPFGAAEKDFEQLPSLNIKQRIFDPRDDNRHFVYVGRGGADMAKALRILFSAIQTNRAKNPQKWAAVKFHFVGTTYAAGDRAVKSIEPVAKEFGVADLIHEHVHRIPYFEALQVLADSQGILLIGSDDSGYTASKLYPCILARKPILGIFHEQSSVVEILRQCNAGRAITFKAADDLPNAQNDCAIDLDWFLSRPQNFVPETDWEKFSPFTAREMTRKQCLVFDRSLLDTGVNQELWK